MVDNLIHEVGELPGFELSGVFFDGFLSREHRRATLDLGQESEKTFSNLGADVKRDKRARAGLSKHGGGIARLVHERKDRSPGPQVLIEFRRYSRI